MKLITFLLSSIFLFQRFPFVADFAFPFAKPITEFFLRLPLFLLSSFSVHITKLRWPRFFILLVRYSTKFLNHSAANMRHFVKIHLVRDRSLFVLLLKKYRKVMSQRIFYSARCLVLTNWLPLRNKSG